MRFPADPTGRVRLLASAVAALGFLAPGSAAGQHPTPACPDPAALTRGFTQPMATIRYLADDALQGRRVARTGARCAGDYVADQFRRIGLEPAAPDGTYFQEFPVRVGATVGPHNVLSVGDRTYAAGSDWTPLGFSGSSEASGELAYGSYGISRPAQAADSTSHDDVSGRILVVERGVPGDPAGESVHSDPHFKASIAAGRGAVGLILLLPRGSGLPDVSDEVRGPTAIPVVAVGGPAADQIREASRRGTRARMRTDVSPRMANARNVLALLPGNDPALSDQWIVVGAHYDHLGLGGQGSLAPDQLGTVHNGADDNASGTADILEIARELHAQGTGRSVLFIAFTGEEEGLWGSTYYVRHPVHPLDKTLAMLNLDMVGRLEGKPVTVYGVGTAREWKDLVDAADRTLSKPLGIAFVADGYGPSDQSSFHAAGLPVLQFFSGMHPDYHRPSDDWQKIDRTGLVGIAHLVTGVALRLAGDATLAAADLTPVQTSDSLRMAVPEPGQVADDSDQGGYGPYLGTIPDMTPSAGKGVRLTGVEEGSPAQKAGIKGGDLVVEFAGRKIGDLYDYADALRARSAGDTVRIVVERDGRRVDLTAILGQDR